MKQNDNEHLGNIYSLGDIGIKRCVKQLDYHAKCQIQVKPF